MHETQHHTSKRASGCILSQQVEGRHIRKASPIGIHQKFQGAKKLSLGNFPKSFRAWTMWYPATVAWALSNLGWWRSMWCSWRWETWCTITKGAIVIIDNYWHFIYHTIALVANFHSSEWCIRCHTTSPFMASSRKISYSSWFPTNNTSQAPVPWGPTGPSGPSGNMDAGPHGPCKAFKLWTQNSWIS